MSIFRIAVAVKGEKVLAVVLYMYGLKRAIPAAGGEEGGRRLVSVSEVITT